MTHEYFNFYSYNYLIMPFLPNADHHPSTDWQIYAGSIIIELKNSMYLTTCDFKLFKKINHISQI